MSIENQLAMYVLQIQTCLEHEFGDLYVQKQNGTLKRRRIERKQFVFTHKLVKLGHFDLDRAKLIVSASKARGRQHVKTHGEINPDGVGRGSKYLDIFLMEIVAPANQAAASNKG